MLSSDKAFVQAYNAQAVDHGSQVIVAANVVQASNDRGQLVPMVEQVCENLDETSLIFSADAGYWAEADLETMEHYEIEAIVAPSKIRHREWREQELITEPPPEGLTRKERMRHLLKTERGRAEYEKRMSTAEPIFGQMKHARGFRQFLLRGCELGMDARLYRSQSAQALRVYEGRGAGRGPSIGGFSRFSLRNEHRELSRTRTLPRAQDTGTAGSESEFLMRSQLSDDQG